MNAAESRRTRQGLLCALGAYSLWGVIPLYFRLLSEVPPLELLAHRVFWSFVLLALLVVLSRRLGPLRRVLADRRALAMLAATSVLIAINWFTFIYAVDRGRVVECSLGYFVTPLMNVLLGVAFLHERLRRVQLLGLVLATVGVLAMTIGVGHVPWISLTLALSFGIYGLLRKTVAADSLLGLFIETTLIAPLAVAYLAWNQSHGAPVWDDLSAGTLTLLLAAGLVTTVPLLLFSAGARRLPLTTLGFLQFLAPTIQFFVAVALLNEPLTSQKLFSFLWIWAAVGCYLVDSATQYRQVSTATAAEVILPPVEIDDELEAELAET